MCFVSPRETVLSHKQKSTGQSKCATLLRRVDMPACVCRGVVEVVWEETRKERKYMKKLHATGVVSRESGFLKGRWPTLGNPSTCSVVTAINPKGAKLPCLFTY
jgi:hypothetical protein